MNFLAHLFLAQPTPDSCLGNLLGDFRRGVDLSVYQKPVICGLENHLLVDRFTDSHPLIQQLKPMFSQQRRRFAPVIIDVVFDYFLIKHWSNYSNEDFHRYKERVYGLLQRRIDAMPKTMASTVDHMITHDWFASYQQLPKVGRALDRIASRIRFQHGFYGAVEEVERHYDELDACFVAFFPQLIDHVQWYGPEA